MTATKLLSKINTLLQPHDAVLGAIKSVCVRLSLEDLSFLDRNSFTFSLDLLCGILKGMVIPSTELSVVIDHLGSLRDADPQIPSINRQALNSVMEELCGRLIEMGS